MNNRILAAALMAATSTSAFNAQADILSFSVGGGGWGQSSSGDIRQQGDPAPVDVNNNLFWQDETQTYLFATLEHPVPIVPNVRLTLTSLDQSGSGNTSFIFDGQDFTGNISNKFDIETLDLLAYWEILDNVVSLDVGLNIRNLKLDYSITDGTNTVVDTVDETVPMLYAMVGGSPLPDLMISGEISYLSYDGSTLSDITARISYTTSFFVGFEAGYRKQTFELDDVSETFADIAFDGVFAGAYLKF